MNRLIQHWLLAGLLLALFPPAAAAQCLTPELALINSCIEHPNPNGSNTMVESELLVVSSGIVPVPVAEFGIDLPFNGFGAPNADIGVDVLGNPLGCTFREPGIDALPGCSNVIPLGPDDVIPPNSLVIIFTTGTTVSDDLFEVDFSNLCPMDEPIYVLQNACERTAGAFANAPPDMGDPLRSITVISECGLRGFTYNTQDLDPDEGSYYLVGLNEAGNLDCALPVLPETCPVIDTTFYICDETGDLPIVTAQELASIYPEEILSVSFHPTAIDAEGNDNRITEYQPTGIPSDTIYARIINSANFCIVIGQLIIEYQSGLAVTMVPENPLRGCAADGAGSGLFNLRLGDAEIGGGQPVTYFEDAEGTMEIINPTEYASSAGTIFARAGIFTCSGDLVAVELALGDGPEVSVVETQTSCPVNDDGAVALTATGFGALTFNWSVDTFPADSGQTDLAAGNYGWTVTDAAGCEAAGVANVSAGPTVTLQCQTTAAVSMTGASDGTIGLLIGEGDGPFQVSYSGAAAGAVEVVGAMGEITGLPAGNYLVQVMDADGCNSATCLTTISEVDPILLDCVVRNNANANIVLGSIGVTIGGGEPLFTVTLAGPNGGMTTLTDQDAGEITFSDLPVGSYTITVTDTAGQTETCTQEIMQDNCPLEVVGVRLLVADCTGSDNSVISLEIAGFQPPINTAWSGGNGITIFDGMNEAGPLPPGTYFAEVSDASGCPPVMVGPIVVEDRGEIVADLVEIIESSACQDAGSVVIVPRSGGSPPYTVILNDESGMELERQTVNPGDTVRFTGLAGTDGVSANYAYFVLDALECFTADSEFLIPRLPQPVLSLEPGQQQVAPPTCFGGSDGELTVIATGGAEPYAYNWIDYPERGAGRILPPGDNQADLPAGDYVIEVTEGGGCIDTLTLNLPDGDRPTINCGATTSALGINQGTVNLTLMANAPPLRLSFLLPDGQPLILMNIEAGDTAVTLPQTGDFLVFALDLNGCSSDTCGFNIAEQACDLAVVATVEPVDCTEEGLLVATVTGGTEPFVYNWSEPGFPAQDTVRPTAAGDYGLVITDANGCTLDTSFVVGEVDNAPDLLTDSLTIIPNCSGDSVRVPVTFTGAGPFTFTFNVDSAGVFLPELQSALLSAADTLVLPASWFASPGGTIFAAEVADQNCSLPLARLTEYELTRPDTIRRNDVTCRPEGIMIGGQLFTAAMPADTFNFDDGSTCGIIYEVDLTFLMPETPDTLEVFICSGTNYEVPETGDVFNAGRPEGEVAFPRDGQCDSLVYFRLNIPEVNLGNFGAGACEGDTIFFGDRFFTIDDPAGIARLAGEAADGCDSLVTVNINFRRVGELRLLGDHAICPGDSIELRFAYDGQGGVNAQLENLQGETIDLNGVGDGFRYLLVPEESTAWSTVSVSAGDCPGEFSGRSEITVSDIALATEVLLNPEDFCVDTLGQAIAFPSGGTEPYGLSWNNGPTDSLNPNLLAGTYFVNLIDGQGCELLDSVVITDRQELRASLTPLPPLCEGRSGRLELDTIFGGGGFYEMSLDGEFFLPIDRINDFRPPVGTGTATFQDVDDCSVEVPFFVPGALRPTFSMRTDTTIFIGDSVLLDPGASFPLDSAWWTPPATLTNPNAAITFARPRNTTDYTLNLLSPDGCAFTYRITVEVDERLPVFAPTVFSPNGDNVNDVYRLEFGPRVQEIMTFQVFNRWGTLIHDGPDGWDGMLEGQPAQTAVYVFQATILLIDGSERFIKGDFVLMR